MVNINNEIENFQKFYTFFLFILLLDYKTESLNDNCRYNIPDAFPVCEQTS